jgi:hypothetical protein
MHSKAKIEGKRVNKEYSEALITYDWVSTAVHKYQ